MKSRLTAQVGDVVRVRVGQQSQECKVIRAWSDTLDISVILPDESSGVRKERAFDCRFNRRTGANYLSDEIMVF